MSRDVRTYMQLVIILNYQTFQPKGLLQSDQKSSKDDHELNLLRDIHIHMQVIAYYVCIYFYYISDFSIGGVTVSLSNLDRERET